MLSACGEICRISYHANATRPASATTTITNKDVPTFRKTFFIDSRFPGSLDGLPLFSTNGALSMLRPGRVEIHFSTSKSSVWIHRARMGPLCHELARSRSSLRDSGVCQEPWIRFGSRFVAGHRHWSEYVHLQHCQCTSAALAS